MPTTSNFGWTTPADTDLVKDGAAAIRTLGNGIDTSLVDLKGGTTGQVLSKNSNTDLDYTWVTPNVGDITEVQAGTGISVASGTGPIPVVTNTVATAYDAKGDLIVGTGADTFSRLAVGTTNGHTLQVDSSTATGLKWAAPASGSGFEGARASKNANQSLNSATATALSFQVEDFDVGGYFTTGSNTRMTIPSGKGGYYLAIAQVAYANSSTSNTSREAWFRVNGSDIRNQSYTVGMNMTRPQIAYAVDILSLNAADYVEVIGYQDSGGALNVINDSNDLSYFAIHYLGA